MPRLIAWFATNHIAANLLLILIVLAGLSAVLTMPQKSFPDIDVPIISVSIPYLGAAPEEVEQGVCIRVEEELDGVEGVKEIRSVANESLCSVTVELFEDADESRALDDVKNRIDALDTLPEETEQPTINLATSIRPVIDLAITGPDDERTLKVLGQRVRDEIAALPGITQVSLVNTRPYEISIEVSESDLQRFGLTFSQVAEAVRARAIDLPGGAIKTEDGEILLRTKGQVYWGEEYERLVLLSRPDGSLVYLSDVARVVDGFEDTDQSLRFDGQPAAIIRVSRIGSEDILAITGAVMAYLDTSAQALPEGVKLTVWNDNSRLLEDRLATLLDSARQGFLMVLLLLALFLRPVLAFWVSVGVPVAFMGALYLTNYVGLSIDGISLFGFILVLGIMVDDAIVVGESVHSRQREGGTPLIGSIEGTQRITIPVIFGVLTTICTFLPMLQGVGSSGQIGAVIATVVICCLIFSLIESQLILPAHLGNKQTKTAKGEVYLLLVPLMVIVLLQFSWSTSSFVGLAIALMTVVYALDRLGLTDDPAKRLIAAQSRFSASVEALIDGPFRRIVQRATQARYTTLAMAFAFFLSGVAVFGSGRLPFSFFPPLAADQVIAQLTMPLGTSSEITEQAVRHLERTGEAIRDELNEQYGAAPPVTHILASVGGSQGGGLGPPGSSGGGASGGHMGEVTLQLTPSQSRTISTKEVAALWRERSGSIAGAVELKFNSSLFSVGNAIDIQLAGNDVDELREVAAGLRAELARYPGVIDITDSFRSGKQELKLKMTPEGEALGLSLGALAQQVRQAFYGEEAQRIQRGRDDVRVMVRYTEAERESLASLDDMRVRTREGSEVPFRTVANASLGQGYSSIKRADRKRVVNVTADVDRTQITADEVVGDLSRSYFPVIRAEHPRVSLSLEGEQRQSGEYLVSLVFPFLIALFAIYALLAIPLRSYVKPFIIMSVIPFAFIGAIWGHQIMKLAGLVSGLAMMSILGMIAAAGVVVNSSLILVYAINQRRDAGSTMADAVVDAATSRCRPIVLTSMTTFVGLMPLMFNTSVQAQFLVPMAVSLSFGVLFATVITLLVVPSIYLFFEDLFALRDRMAGDSRRASIQNAM
ncbi:MAG: efflux RND transporter permease subunit [Gammaproteobacteria bacterium]